MWLSDPAKIKAPVVVGGLGGSGTRIVASILRALDFDIGSHLNEQLDNLWFTFLLRRPRTFRSLNDKKILYAIEMFDEVMKNTLSSNFKTKTELYKIVFEFIFNSYVRGKERILFPLNCRKSILERRQNSEKNYWGWKEPNAHLFIPQLVKKYPNMKFILMIRHPLDMMYGNNFLQLNNWYHLFNLPKPTELNKHELMLEYYSLANTRAIDIGKKLLGNNFLVMKYESLCNEKEKSIRELISFLNLRVDVSLVQKLISIPKEAVKKNISSYKPTEKYQEVLKQFDYV